MAYQIYALVLLAISTAYISEASSKSDVCEYDLDLQHNHINIKCEGSPAKVTVYADQASVQADDVQNANYGVPVGAVGEYNKFDPGMANNGPTTSHNSHNGNKNYRQNDLGAGSNHRSDETSRNFNGHQPTPDQQVPIEHPHRHHAGAPQPLPEPKYHVAFQEYVWNATRKLDKAKRQLSTYSDSIKNTTTRLAVGDLKLREDMKNLKATRNSATELKDGIIAAMRNQYNFIRSTLLAKNAELERLVTSLSMLVEVTSDGLHNALDAHKRVMEEVTQVNHTLLAVRKMVSNELRKKNKSKKKKGEKPKELETVQDEEVVDVDWPSPGNYEDIKYKAVPSRSDTDTCPKDISAIGAGSGRMMDSQSGAYMVESYNPSTYLPVYIMKGAGPNDQLLEYDADEDVTYNLVGRYYSLPFFCVGTGSAIFRRHFYCHKADTNSIVKYHLKRMDIVSEMVLPGAVWGNIYPYTSGAYSDVDLAVDELGLWALYATNTSGGNLVISKINHRQMEIEKTWETNYPKQHLGNAFIICGVLYAINSHSDAPTFIRYIYNTETSTEQTLEPGDMPFANFATVSNLGESEGTPTVGRSRTHRTGVRGREKSNTSMLSYDFRQSKLFSWNNGRIEAFPIYFKDMP